jgi:Hsp70 protein
VASKSRQEPAIFPRLWCATLVATGGAGFETWLLHRIPRSISKSSETMTTRPLYVGIDLGTTNSTVAVFDGEEITLIRNNQGSVLTPSVVRIDARGNVTVGASEHPQRVQTADGHYASA